MLLSIHLPNFLSDCLYYCRSHLYSPPCLSSALSVFSVHTHTHTHSFIYCSFHFCKTTRLYGVKMLKAFCVLQLMYNVHCSSAIYACGMATYVVIFTWVILLNQNRNRDISIFSLACCRTDKSINVIGTFQCTSICCFDSPPTHPIRYCLLFILDQLPQVSHKLFSPFLFTRFLFRSIQMAASESENENKSDHPSQYSVQCTHIYISTHPYVYACVYVC